jgi:O-antigen chain-terminating methyltransferase
MTIILNFEVPMDNPVIEIRDEEINVEEIMKTIRENIRRRKEAGLIPEDPEIGPSSSCSVPSNHSSNNCDLSYITGNYDIQNNNYFISSHRPYIGKYLVKGRSLVHGEVRRYIDPVIWKQTEFNRHTVNAFDSFNSRLNEFNSLTTRISEIDGINNRLNVLDNLTTRISEIDGINNRLNVLDNLTTRISEIDGINNRLNVLDNLTTRISEIESSLLALASDIENKTWLAQVLEKRISHPKTFESEREPTSPPIDGGINYFVFEDRFRGPRVLIKDRQKTFLKYFEGCRNVLDIGCGRGEFLELMNEQGIGAHGVDLDETMVDYCQMRGLEVELKDAISYLEGLEDSSLDGIFIDQVVEHLEPGYLIRLLQLCYQKMQYGFYLVAETVNPLSFFSFANFYFDLTHVRPVHPETLRFLFDNAGFRELEVNFSSPVTDDSRLQKIPSGEERGVEERNQVEVYNRNVEMLNGILYGAQDFSVVGKK